MQRIKRKQLIIIVPIVVMILVVIIFYVNNYNKTDIIENELIEYENEIEENIENITKKEEKSVIVIYITGAIKKEGVYKIEEGSRISDAIEIAGGLKENADIEEINLASLLEDGMKIYIPDKDEKIEENVEKKEEKYTSNDDKNKTDKRKQIININKATQSELETLPGIGPSIAIRILEYKKKNGNFKKIEDIKNVKGIGENKYKNIKDYIKV